MRTYFVIGLLLLLFSCSKKEEAPIEIYHNSPTNTPEGELISEIQFAVK